jgi:hypothetical protein
MKTIHSSEELGLEHGIEEGDVWVHSHTGLLSVFKDGKWDSSPQAPEEMEESENETDHS